MVCNELLTLALGFELRSTRSVFTLSQQTISIYMPFRMASNSQFSYLSLPKPGITSMNHHMEWRLLYNILSVKFVVSIWPKALLEQLRLWSGIIYTRSLHIQNY